MNNNINTNLLFEDLKNEHLDMLLKDLKNKLEYLDLKIRNSSWRKEQNYYANGLVERTLFTSEGSLTFKRTKFKQLNSETNQWKTVFLLDEFLQLERNQKLTNEFQFKILEKVIQGFELNLICKSFPRAPINKATITRFIQKINIPYLTEKEIKKNYVIPETAKNYERIYISVDDTFVKLKTKDKISNKSSAIKYRIRMAILYQGVSEKSNQKSTILINKRIIYKIEKANQEDEHTMEGFNEYLKNKIKIFYGDKKWKLVVSGDGDRYIKQVAKYLDADIVLDWFHLKAKLRQAFKFSKYQNNEYLKIMFNDIAEKIKLNPLNAISNDIEPLLKTKKYLKKRQTTSLLQYIRNNLKGIQSYQEEWYNGCYAESNIYQFIKSVTYGRSLSISVFENLLALKSSITNTMNPLKIDILKDATVKQLPIFNNFFKTNNEKIINF